MHVSKEKRLKLDNKGISYIFIGYGDEEFEYRFWDPENKRIMRSRDVVFYENQIVEDFKREQQHIKATIELSHLQQQVIDEEPKADDEIQILSDDDDEDNDVEDDILA